MICGHRGWAIVCVRYVWLEILLHWVRVGRRSILIVCVLLNRLLRRSNSSPRWGLLLWYHLRLWALGSFVSLWSPCWRWRAMFKCTCLVAKEIFLLRRSSCRCEPCGRFLLFMHGLSWLLRLLLRLLHSSYWRDLMTGAISLQFFKRLHIDARLLDHIGETLLLLQDQTALLLSAFDDFILAHVLVQLQLLNKHLVRHVWKKSGP